MRRLVCAVLVLGGCTATPIQLPLNDTWAPPTSQDGGLLREVGIPKLDSPRPDHKTSGFADGNLPDGGVPMPDGRSDGIADGVTDGVLAGDGAGDGPKGDGAKLDGAKLDGVSATDLSKGEP